MTDLAGAICALSARRTRAAKLAFANALSHEMQRGLVSIIPLPLFAATVRAAWAGRTKSIEGYVLSA